MKRFSIVFLILCLASANSPCWGAEAMASGKVELPRYKKIKLDNGLTLLLMERHQLPLVSFHWLMKSGGSIDDPPGYEGVASLTAQLLRKGTETRTADQIAQSLDFVGATFDAGAADEFSTGSAEFLKKDLDLALDVLSDTLLHPSFPSQEVDKMVQQEIDGIAEAKSVPGQVIGRYFKGFLFGKHPYARPTGGTETSLAKIKRDEIMAFYTTHYVPNELIMAVVGDFSANELEANLRNKLGTWKSKELGPPQITSPAPVTTRRAMIVTKPDSTQTFFELGNIGLARTNADWISVQVVNTLFGGRFTSMINSDLRIQSGLTYGAKSQFSERRVPGAFTISSYTPNDSTQRALDMTLAVIKRLHEKGVSQDQLQSAKAYVKGQFGPKIETNDQLADLICDLEFYGLGPEYINTYFDKVDALTVLDAKRVIDTYFPLKGLAFVLIGQSAVIEPVAHKLADSVTKKSITDPGF